MPLRSVAIILNTALSLFLLGGCTSANVGSSAPAAVVSPSQVYSDTHQLAFPNQDLGVTAEMTVTLQLPAAGSAQIVRVAGLNQPFQFKGGNYPGTGGTCGQVIFQPCTMVIEFTPSDVVSYQTQIQITYMDGATQASYLIPLSGRGAFALGQTSLSSNIRLVGGVRSPTSVAFAGSRLVVGDYGNNRVLIWNSIPVTDATPPDLVLGQSNFTSRKPNVGGVTASSLNGPISVSSDGTRLVVSDYSNHRVLIWNTFPTKNAQPADVVVGQPNMRSSAANRGGAAPSNISLYYPRQAIIAGTRLYVADYANNRVLGWSTVPSTYDAKNPNVLPADLLIGQASFSSHGTGSDAQSLSSPFAVATIGSRLFVSDYSNNRVLAFDAGFTGIKPAALFAFGQATLTGNAKNAGGNVAANTLYAPAMISSDGTHLILSDLGNQRVLVWQGTPTATIAPTQAPTYLLGQANFTTGNGMVRSGNPSALSVASPYGAQSDGTRVAIADYGNNRILLWNAIPKNGSIPADVVLGQPAMTANVENNGGSDDSGVRVGLSNSAFCDGVRLFVADTTNNRVLIWSHIPATPDVQPDLVLGQSDFMSIVPNSGGRTTGMYQPTQARVIAGKLFVVDRGNHRVMVWNSLPTSNRQPADWVIGQPNLTAGSVNAGAAAPSLSTLHSPVTVAGDATSFYIADSLNNRVLVYKRFPSAGDTAADFALGQADGTGGAGNRGIPGTPAANTLYEPYAVETDGAHVWVADTANDRVLMWNSPPTQNGAPADVVVGQAGMTTRAAASGSTGLSGPYGVTFSGSSLYIVDTGNNRILIYKSFPTQNGAAADSIFGQPDPQSNASGLGGQSFYGLSSLSIADGLWVIEDPNNYRAVIMPAPDGSSTNVSASAAAGASSAQTVAK